MSNLVINITPLNGAVQGEEAFQLEFSDGQVKVIKSWDYVFIYSIPYLYGKLFCDLLGYKGFQELGDLLLKHAPERFKGLQVLDVACGSGLMGKFLKEASPLKIESIVGVDVLPEAITALNRDYPNIYDSAFVISKEIDFQHLRNYSFNCLSICGGANQVKLEEIKKYINCLSNGAYVVFNLRIEDKENTRKRILDWMDKELSFCESKIYNHRQLGNGSIVRHEAFLYEKIKKHTSGTV